MKFTTFYFSGTGNTRWAVNTFNGMIREKGQQAAMISIDLNKVPGDEKILELVEDGDIIGIAHPIYGADLPPIMRKFLKRFFEIIRPVQPGKKVFVITTYGYVNAFGAKEMQNLFSETPLELVAYENIHLCNNVVDEKNEPIDREVLRKRMKRGEEKLDKLAEALIAGKRRIKGHGPQTVMGSVIRKNIPELIGDFYQSLGVEESDCVRCMICVNNCPTQSIQYDEEKGFLFQPECTACQRCFNICPTGAITRDGIKVDLRVHPRYKGPETF